MADDVKKTIGYTDTPIIPGTCWRVHDGDRPQPRVVTPGSFSTQETPGTPPSDAIILFDGTCLCNWVDKANQEAKWKVENGYMEVVPKTGNIHTKTEFGDCQLHLEFAAPETVVGDGQGRGNSGVFFMRKYEIQVLDCFENPTYPDGTTGGIYGQYPPLANACRKPGQWNMYDFVWIAPRFAGTTLVSPAYITVFLNGVLLHHMRALQGPTQHRILAEYKPQNTIGALELQDHSNPVRFRNIWYRPLTTYDQLA
ncbi:MAG: DUF1080 domain-containing protein [Lentisphaeria bacterium]|nr:DUF1080 domain-containing protein [Lentisphaeria bacterium]